MTSAWAELGVKVSREHFERGGDPFTRFTCLIERARPAADAASPRAAQPGEVEILMFTRAAAPAVIGVQAEFRPETTWTRLTKFLSDELQTDDATFDDDVFIVTKQREAAAALLRSPAVREALREFAKAGRVSLKDGTVIVEVAGKHTDDPPALRRLMSAYLAFAR